MSRSAADATRFTATGPYASSKPAGSGTPYKLPSFMSSGQNASPQGPGGHQETPKEKVERLRAQARAARMAQSTSRVDTMIDSGRKIANKAHKAMVYTLIAASGICGALTVYSAISLTLYNRRQKALWLDNELQKLRDAQAAYANGTATPEQAEIVKNETIGEIYKQKKEEEKEQRPWNKAKRYLLGGLKTDEAAPKAQGGDKPGVLRALEESKSNDAATAAAASQSQPQGQLDVLAENAESATKQTTRSWTSWITGR
ncbi:hypothetical protein ASPWEDRAFT_38478 [Aspergillus wentii DTO 134E9]|uniref:Cytochrome oxidase c assembly-domain-containing protein n=1 Tax=Aspergillus wentii DTO 134E9 TaxID=1073089 RepID=A0A1L9RPH6_ASPWE|nr:uncharacterized protein ASPWEDRAFT_38478 [Aspergillus wentii DTO 134E9]KAI9924126.1 hypothetical protein MW887_007366 [Aspergillus wentii]OJJ36829.1 hypothetical protein ASPWEDRAFT_38478 [Aspergillus wentii DTO 134E9]